MKRRTVVHFNTDAHFPFRTLCGAGRGRVSRIRIPFTTTDRSAVTCTKCRARLNAGPATVAEARAAVREEVWKRSG